MGKIKSILMLLVAAGLFYGAYHFYGQWKERREIQSGTSQGTQWSEVASSSSSFVPSSEATEHNLDNIAEPADWKHYRNADFGFSLNVPQKVLGVDHCSERKFEAPITVLEDSRTKAVFIVPEYSYEKYTPSDEELRDKSGDIIFDEDDPIDEGDPDLSDTDGDGINDCRKMHYSLSLIKMEIAGTDRLATIPIIGNPKLGIAVRTRKVEDTDALNAFLREVFGSGCVLSKKIAVEGREGLYKLEISNSEGADRKGNKLACATDKVTDIFYDPSRDKVAYAFLPEGGMFFSDEGISYDEEMMASLRLE